MNQNLAYVHSTGHSFLETVDLSLCFMLNLISPLARTIFNTNKHKTLETFNETLTTNLQNFNPSAMNVCPST